MAPMDQVLLDRAYFLRDGALHSAGELHGRKSQAW